MERYVIRGGKEGYDRLLLLARDRWPDTAALFERAALSPGMRCIDLGCGGGEVTLEIARLVAPGGSVTGVDMDEIKLDLARRAAAGRGLGNVEFRRLNVQDWDKPGAYDAVYCRFRPSHFPALVETITGLIDWPGPIGIIIANMPGKSHPGLRSSGITAASAPGRYPGADAASDVSDRVLTGPTSRNGWQ